MIRPAYVIATVSALFSGALFAFAAGRKRAPWPVPLTPLGGPWRRLTSPELGLMPGRTYAAVIDLSGFDSLFGSSDAIREKLLELGAWKSLRVFDQPPKLPAAPPPPPWTTIPDSGRYWAIGSPSAQLFGERPEQVTEFYMLGGAE